MHTQYSAAPASSANTSTTSSPTLRVLVAEDNAVNQRVAQRMLEKLGCLVDIANNGFEALALSRQNEYAVIFMDCQMPQMDGYEATAKLRGEQTNGKHIPIVALTASASVEDRNRCLGAGMDDYLTKPVTLDFFRSALNRWASG